LEGYDEIIKFKFKKIMEEEEIMPYNLETLKSIPELSEFSIEELKRISTNINELSLLLISVYQKNKLDQ
jgi:hypothetical protein